MEPIKASRFADRLYLSEDLTSQLQKLFGTSIIEALNQAWLEGFGASYVSSHVGADMQIYSRELLAEIDNYRVRLNRLKQRSVAHTRGYAATNWFLKDALSNQDDLLNEITEELSALVVQTFKGRTFTQTLAGKTKGRSFDVPLGEFIYQLAHIILQKRSGRKVIQWKIILQILKEQSHHDKRLMDKVSQYRRVSEADYIASIRQIYLLRKKLSSSPKRQ